MLTHPVIFCAAFVGLFALSTTAAMYDTTISGFETYVTKFNKKYATEQHRHAAYQNFIANAIRAEEMQKKNPLAKFGMTKFSDISAADFKQMVGGKRNRKMMDTVRRAGKPLKEVFKQEVMQNAAIPQVVNWVTAGAVTPVNNMGDCGGACVAFSVIENVEGVNFVVNKVLVPLSAGEVVECAVQDGCDGGWMDTTIQWLLNNTHGEIATAASYPYNNSDGHTGKCRKNDPNIRIGAIIRSLVLIPKHESDIARTCAMTGPVSVGVDAMDWQTYISGTLTDCGSTQVDSAVVAVGYNDEAKVPYWLLKNNWGADWGMEGYIQIVKGTNACGINEDANTVTVLQN